MRFNSIEFGMRIRNLREKAKYTKGQFAELLDISMEHLKSIESGRRNCSINVMIQISLIFDVSLDYLILGQDSRFETVKMEIQEAVNLLEQIRQKL